LGFNSGLGLNGLNPLSSIANSFTFTTPPGGPTIPSITIPAGQLGPICGAGVTVAAGTVAVTEVVPAGFTLTSVTGGTLSGTTAGVPIIPESGSLGLLASGLLGVGLLWRLHRRRE